MVAGQAVGKWDIQSTQIELHCTTFKPSIGENERDMRYSKWKMAVERSLGWDV